MKKQILNAHWWVKKHISAVAFATGFLWDTFTLTRIDLVYENIVFVTYLIVALIGIFLVHGVDTRVFAPQWLLRVRAWLPGVVQFPMGGLFSGFVIFYTKSASVLTSWPFLLILFFLFVGNEFFRKRYERLIFQISLFYFALLSYLVLIVPVLLNTMGTATFVLSGAISLFMMSAILALIGRVFPKLYKQGARHMWTIVIAIFVVFNALYFSNTIPPVPLALKDIGVFHNVVRTETGGYLVSYERPAWYEIWRQTSGVFHRSRGEAVYCYSSVFAPTRLRTPIYHSWQRKGEHGEWIREDRIPYTIEGGRDGGYRGYTIKQSIDEGSWRCVVETSNQLVIGEVRFNIVSVAEPYTQVSEVR
jgi:hypothetical protein